MTTRRLPLLLSSLLTLAACAPEPASTPDVADELASAELELSSSAPTLLEPGAGLALLGVTTDRFAIYQSGNDVLARRISKDGKVETIATLEDGAVPFVEVRGRVVFVWTNASAAVSRLVIWSSCTGAHLASSASVVASLATEASPSGKHVIFLEAASPDGSSANLVMARTDFHRKTVLAAGLANDACAPLAGFLRDGDDDEPIAVSCAAGTATASLKLFTEEGESTLAEGLRVPTTLAVNRSATRAYTVSSKREGLMVDAHGRSKTVDQGPAGSGFWTGEDAVTYAARTSDGIELRRATWHGTGSVQVAPRLASFAAFMYGVRDSAVSPDGTKIPFVTVFDPATGIADQHVLEARRSSSRETVAESAQQTLLCGLGALGPANPFTGDSSNFLFAQKVDPTTFLSPLAAFDGTRVRQFSDELGYSCTPAARSWVVFNDHTDLNSLTADLKVVNVADSTATARLLWSGAALNYVVTADGRQVAFTTVTAAGNRPAGLYAVGLPH